MAGPMDTTPQDDAAGLACDQAQPSTPPRFDARALIALERVCEVVPSPQGDWLAVTTQRLDAQDQSAYIHDLWRVPLSRDPAARLTCGEHQDRHPRFRADGALAFLSDRPSGHPQEGAKPRTQVWLYPRHGGDAIRLTDEPLGVQRVAFASAADVFVVQTHVLPGVPAAQQRQVADERAKHGPSGILYERMPARRWDHWLPEHHVRLVAYLGSQRVELTPQASAELREAHWALSPDGRWLAITPAQPTSPGVYEPQGSALELIELPSGRRLLLAAGERCWHSDLVFCPRGRWLAYRRAPLDPARQGGSSVWLYDMTTKAHRQLIAHEDCWFIPMAIDERGAWLYGVADQDGQTPALRIDLAQDRLERLSQRSGTYGQLALLQTSDRLIGLFDSFTQPPEPFFMELAGQDHTPDRTPDHTQDQTRGQPQLLGPLSSPEALELAPLQITYTHAIGPDQAPCPYYVIKRADLTEPAPALMWIHGGPIGQWSDTWHWRWNSLIPAHEGMVMILPNPRGSTGLGQRWIEGIWGNTWGGACYHDLMAVADDVAQRPDVDASRMVAMGGSFGGYMTHWIGTQTDRFCALISHAGITSLRSFHGVTDNPVYWAWMHAIDPLRQPEAWDRYSPLTHITAWRTPALIIHGQQDYRVPVGESLILFDALQALGVPSKLLIYPDENHWILRPRNIVSWYGHVLDFIKAHTNIPSQARHAQEADP